MALVKKESPARDELQLPEKVTLAWVFRHVSVSVWIWFGSIILAVLALGVGIGQTTFIQELVRKEPTSSSIAPTLSSTELKNRVDQLIQSHTAILDKLYAAIAEEEQRAGNQPYNLDRSPHIEAADRLRDTVKHENETFEAKLKALKSLEQ